MTENKARKLPRVWPRFLPKINAKFKLRHLQPLPRMLYERTAELTGHPVKELLPLRSDHRSGLDALKPIYTGMYSVAIHAISIPSFLSIEDWRIHGKNLRYRSANFDPRTSTGQHEQMHSLHVLLGKTKQNWLEEAIADVGYGSSLMPFNVHSHLYLGINEFYHRYGPDGLLALMAHQIPMTSSPP